MKPKSISALSLLLFLALLTTACSSPAAEPLAATPVPPEPDAEADLPVPAEPSGQLVFLIDPSATEARFIIDEVLRGEPTTVVGVTNEVTGQIMVDAGDPSQTEIEAIEIAAGSLTTDNNFRNGAIRDLILQSNSYPVISFTPISVEGLPEQGVVGETYDLTITGALTIRFSTQEVTFEATVTPTSESRLEGSATTTISRSDFGLTIPTVPNVADVSDEVILEIDFVAIAS